ncbi:MAG: tetratricopeptide repeat protein [Calditrichaceae bacterium]
MKKIIYISAAVIISLNVTGCTSSKKLVPSEAATETVSLKARDHYLQGLFLQMEERFEEAFVQFDQALLYDSTSATIHNSLAYNRMKLGNYDTALYYLEKAARLDSLNEETLQLKAECYFRLKQDDKAITAYKELLRLNPYNEDARNFLLFLYEKNQDEMAKAQLYEQLIDLYGSDRKILEQIANIYLRNMQHDKAIHYYNEILKSDSTDAGIWYMLGRIEENRQNFDEAKNYYNRAVTYKPDFIDAIEHLAMLYRREQEWQKVIDLYQPLFKRDSTDLSSRIMIAESKFYLEDLVEAKKLLLPVINTPGIPWGAFDIMGRIELNAKNHDAAIGYFRKIIKEDRKNRFGWLYLGFTYNDMDSLKKAEKIYSEAIEELPEDASLWTFYGITLQELKKYREAIPPLQKALELEPMNFNALSTLPVVYESLKMYTQSDSLYDEGLKRFPDNHLLLNNYGYSLSERNIRMNDALAMAQKAIEAQPDNPAYLDTVGWIYYKLGNLEEAARNIERSIQVRETSSVVLDHLGDIYYEMGKLIDANILWEKALELEPDNENVKTKLEKNK